MENETHPVQRSLAPWTLKAESYLLFLKLKELPLGLYDRLEEAWEDENLGRFEGGLGAVMIVRYSETPVGGFFSTFSLHYIYIPRLHLSSHVHSPSLNFKSTSRVHPCLLMHLCCCCTMHGGLVALRSKKIVQVKELLSIYRSRRNLYYSLHWPFFLFCVVKCLRMYP